MMKQGPLSGQVVGGKYLLGELLGKGGFGAVYKATNQMLARPQAVKVLLEEHFSDVKFRDRFLREARTLAALDHANIVHVDDIGVQGNLIYLVMPYLSGGTLQDMMKARSGPLSLDEIGRSLEQICSALGYAHAQGVVHLDLKPLNLLIHQDGRLLLSDFGLAHLMEQGAVEGGTSLQFGSPLYMAPEHFDGKPEQRSDLYAVGIILYQMLTGRHPFEASTPAAVMRKQLTEPPPPLRQVRPDLPANLEAMMAVALAKQPANRFQSAAALLVAFKQVVAGQAPATSSPTVYGSNEPTRLSQPGAFAGPNDPTPASQPFYDPTVVKPSTPSGPPAGPMGRGPGPLMPPPPPGQQYVLQVPWQPGAQVVLPPGMVLAPPPGYRPPAQQRGRVWSSGFKVAFVLTAAGGLLFTLIAFLGVRSYPVGYVGSTTVSDVILLVADLGFLATAIVGMIFVKSWLSRAGLIVLAIAIALSLVTDIVILRSDVTNYIVPQEVFFFYFPAVFCLLTGLALALLAYGMARWQTSPDIGLLAAQVLVACGGAAGISFLEDFRSISLQTILGGASIAFLVFAAMALLVRPSGWKQTPIVVVLLALGALLFLVHGPGGFLLLAGLLSPLTRVLSEAGSVSLFYVFYVLAYALLAPGILLLGQTERVRKRAQQAQPAPAAVGQKPS